MLAILLFGLTSTVSAHEIPNDVAVHGFVKPEGQYLRLLVRVPLKACRDIQFPTRGPGYLDLARVDPQLREAATVWISDSVEIFEGDVKLQQPRVVETRVSLESDRSFATYEEAQAHVTGPPLPNETELYWNLALLDVLFEYPIQSDQSAFSVRPGFGRLGLRVVTVLRFLPTDGAIRAFEFDGDPGLVRLDPRWHQAAMRFIEAGFIHILSGTDHLLFLFCLVIPFRRFGSLIKVVTAFTVAHSLTLIAAAYNLGPDALWFPALIETLIAVSIVYMALENIVGKSRVERRWMITLGFGLVHGFGFSFVLGQTLQFAGSHLLTSLVSFNVGVEIGQLLVLILLIPVLELMFRFVVAERIGTIILSAIVAHTGWHWMIERGGALSKFQWPALDAAGLASAMRWMIVILILSCLVWLVAAAVRKRTAIDPEGQGSNADSDSADGAGSVRPFPNRGSDELRFGDRISMLVEKVRPARR